MECIHELPEGTCSTCNARSARDLLRAGARPKGWVVIEAGFDSRCPGCDGFIGAGEQIYKAHPDEAFICESCATTEMRKAMRE